MKKIISTILTICLLLTFMSSAFAAEESLPAVDFGVEYVENETYFKVSVAITVNNYDGDARVMVGAYKNEILQKLLINEKIDTSSLSHSKVVRFDVIMETDKPQDYVFKCFTLESNLKPILPAYVIKGEDTTNPNPSDAIKLKGIVYANTVTDIRCNKMIDTTMAAGVKISITDNFDTTEEDFKDNIANNSTLDINHNGYFLVGETDAEAYLGMSVIFYVVKNEYEDMYEIVSIEADSTKNETLSFRLDQFNIVKTDASGTYIEYYKEATDIDPIKAYVDNRVVNAESQLNTVYNGVGGQTLKGDILDDGSGTYPYVEGYGRCLFDGSITLVNNDSDTAYDVAFVEVAVTAVVKKALDDCVAFKQSVILPGGYNSISELFIDAGDTDSVISIIKDGEVIEHTDLAEWDVLSIVAEDSADPKYIVAEVISTQVAGEIEYSFPSATSYHGVGYIIAGNRYDVAMGAYGAADLDIGCVGTFYIDKSGRIAAANIDDLKANENYGFVTKAVVKADEINGNTVTIQMVTDNGVEAFDLATSVSYKYVGGEATKKPADAVVSYDHDGDFDPYDLVAYASNEIMADVFFYGDSVDYLGNPTGAANGTLKGQVIRYVTDTNGKINAIMLADHDSDRFDDKGISTSWAQYDAENLAFATYWLTYVDADAKVFFVDMKSGTEYNTDKCLVGTLADLEDKCTYNLLAVYADSSAIDNNIIVIQGGLNVISPTANVAVITDVAQTQIDGDRIYLLTYIQAGEEITAETVPVIELGDYTTTAPTIGDVVKVKVNSEGKISALSKVWDFYNGVRSGAADVPFTVGTPGINEAFDGGYVTAYKESSGQATIGGSTYKLSQAENVYTIEATNRGVTVKNGTLSGYKYYENLYDAPFSTIKVDGVTVAQGLIPGTVAWENAVRYYTDHIFVRTYEGKVKDVVIVKGISRVSVSAVDAATVIFDTSGFDASGAALPAALTVAKGSIFTLPSVAGYVSYYDGTPATGWSTDGTAAGAVANPLTVTYNMVLYMY